MRWGRFKDFNPTARIVHIDIDPAEIGKNFHTHAPVNGDVRETLLRLLPRLEPVSHPQWRAEIEAIKADHPTNYIDEGTAVTGPWLVQGAGGGDRGASDGGDSGSASTRCGGRSITRTRGPRQWVTSGGLGTVGL